MAISPIEQAALEKLIQECGSLGYPLMDFIEKVKVLGIEHPLPFLKNLREQGFFRIDKPDKVRKRALIKPLRQAYVVLGMVA